jgi:hypothetical protein
MCSVGKSKLQHPPGMLRRCRTRRDQPIFAQRLTQYAAQTSVRHLHNASDSVAQLINAALHIDARNIGPLPAIFVADVPSSFSKSVRTSPRSNTSSRSAMVRKNSQGEEIAVSLKARIGHAAVVTKIQCAARCAFFHLTDVQKERLGKHHSFSLILSGR